MFPTWGPTLERPAPAPAPTSTTDTPIPTTSDAMRQSSESGDIRAKPSTGLDSEPSRLREPGTLSGSRDQPRPNDEGNPRSRSRSPPRRPLSSRQGENANNVYFTQLTSFTRETEHYVPTFNFTKDSRKASQVRGTQWEDLMFNINSVCLSASVHNSDDF